MDHSKLIASIQKEEFISSFKSSANYCIQQQSLNYMHMIKTPNLVNFVLMSLTELYLQQIMQVSWWKHTCYGKFLWSLFLVTNIKWEKPAAHVIWGGLDLGIFRVLGVRQNIHLNK